MRKKRSRSVTGFLIEKVAYYKFDPLAGILNILATFSYGIALS